MGREGNGDGTADPLNINDAALSSETYLYANGPDLITAERWTDAIHAYNQSDAYIGQVRDQASEYAATAGAGG